MKYWITLLLTSFAFAQKPIVLALGEKLRLPSPPSSQITLSQKGIVSIQEEDFFITLTAQKTGNVQLIQNTSTINIYVVFDYQKKGWLEFINIIQQNPWLNLSRSSQNPSSPLVLQGHFYRFRTWKKLYQLSEKHQIPYTTKAKASQNVQQQAVHFFKSQLKHHPFIIHWNKPITVQVNKNFQNSFFSHFGISTQKGKQFSPFVELHLLFAQVSHSWFKNFHLQSSLDWSLFSIDHIAQKYFNKGEGKITDSIKILTESGQTAKYISGGETPVHHIHLETSSKSIRWKPYGINITITPKVLFQNQIELNISANISEIDHAHSSEGSPAVKTLNFQTTLTAVNNKTLILSQLNRNHVGSFSRKPFSLLHSLSSLALSRGSSFEKSQSLIFITPKIIRRKLSL